MNDQNNVVVTLTESTTLPSPVYYFFKFFREYSTLPVKEGPIYFTSPDLSPYPERYNLFSITESDTGSTVDVNDTPIKLIPGQWNYEVYQSAIVSFDPSDWLGPIEVGRMVVDGTDGSVDPIYR